MTKNERILSIVFATFLLLTILNSTWFFLGIAKVSIIQWVVFNACAPSSIAYLLGLFMYFQTLNKLWLSIAIIPMMFFGSIGLFVFPWDTWTDLLVQMSHIVMTINIVWSLKIVLKERDYESLGKGLLISTLVFIPFIAFTQDYCRNHAEEVMRYLNI